MNDQKRLEFVAKEIEAITTELEPILKQLSLLNMFVKDVSEVAKGNEPSYNFNEFKNR